jgi:hypothetical protein
VIGVCTIKKINILLVVLPMTDLTGALYVKKRIERDFPCHDFIVDGITVRIEPVVKASTYNKKLTPDAASFFETIYQHHCRPIL